jgi:hypothetical protein
MRTRNVIVPLFATLLFGCGQSINTQLVQKLSTDPRKILLVYREPKDTYWLNGGIERKSPKRSVIEFYNSTSSLQPIIELKQVATIKTLVGDLIANSTSDLFSVFTASRSNYRAVYYIYDRDETDEPGLILGARPIFPCSDNRYVELLQQRSDSRYVGGHILNSQYKEIPEIKAADHVELLSVIMRQVADGNYNLESALSYANDEMREHLSGSHFSDQRYPESLESAIKAATRDKSLNDSSYIWLYKSVSSDIANLKNTDDLRFLQSFLRSSFVDQPLQLKLSDQIDTKLGLVTTIEGGRLAVSSFKDIRLATNLIGDGRTTVEKYIESLNKRIKKRLASGGKLLLIPSLIEVKELNSNVVQIHLTGDVDVNELRKNLAESRQTSPLNPSDWNAAIKSRFTLTEEAFQYIDDLEFDGYLNLYKVTVTRYQADASVAFNAFKNRTHAKVELLKGMIQDALQGSYLVDFYREILALQVIPHAHYVPVKGDQEIVYDILQTRNSGNEQIHYLRQTTRRTTLTGKKSPEDKFLDFFSIAQ